MIKRKLIKILNLARFIVPLSVYKNLVLAQSEKLI